MMSTTPRVLSLSVLLTLAGCTIEGVALLPGPGSNLGDDGDEASTDEGDTDEGDDTTPGGMLDLGGGGEALAASCVLGRDSLDAPLPCELPLTSASLQPQLAWSWTGPAGEDSVLVTPLVANLDDDNLDGFVDLCDGPDVVVVAVDLPGQKGAPTPAGHVYLLDGRTGAVSLRASQPVDASVTPAIADLDGDGQPEIITLEHEGNQAPAQMYLRRLVAISGQGTLLWVGDSWTLSAGGGAIAIADLDGDGSPEILAPDHVADAQGQLLWAPSGSIPTRSAPIAVDLDLDGDLEVLFGASAYDHQGNLLFDGVNNQKNVGMAAVANFDDDPFPEIYVQANNHRILEHDGSKKTQCAGGATNPVAIIDLDDDGVAEVLFSDKDTFGVLKVENDECSVDLSLPVDEVDGASSGTAFDLLADGEPELIHADRSRLRIYDGQGGLLFQAQRSARSSQANPVIVDADNDGAAEILVVSSKPLDGDGSLAQGPTPTVMLFENADDSFAPTRRIWNQHAYDGRNIGEDGSVPMQPPTTGGRNFRTNVGPTGPSGLCQLGDPVE